MAQTLATFHWVGHCWDEKHLWKMEASGVANCVVHLFTIWGLMLSGPSAFFGSTRLSYCSTSSLVMVMFPSAALVRVGTAGGARSGSPTDILVEKWAANNCALSWSRVTTEPSGFDSRGMLSSGEKPCYCLMLLHHSLLPTDWPVSFCLRWSFQLFIAYF